MTPLPLISSLLLISLADYLAWRYKTKGKIVWGELSKVCYLGFGFCLFWIPFSWNLVLVWLLLHYPIHQVLQGTLRHGQPLYLGTGYFDRVIRILTGNAWWMYLISLVASAAIGIHFYINNL